MSVCTHSHWFGLQVKESCSTFIHSDRPEKLLQSLPRSITQKPSIIVALGGDLKTSALQELLPGRIDRRKSNQRYTSETHLYLDSTSAFSERPVLFVDGDVCSKNRVCKGVQSAKCHEVSHIALEDSQGLNSLSSLSDDIHFKLLSPFADVFCIFAVDFGGLEAVASRLSAWINNGPDPTTGIKTAIVIVVEATVSEAQEDQLLNEFHNLLKRDIKGDVSLPFADVRIVALTPAGVLSTQARYFRLREALMAASDQVRAERLSAGRLFSAYHLAAFLGYACNDVRESYTCQFDFVRASRRHNPPSSDLSYHLSTLMSQMHDLNELKEIGIPLISSSLLLDSYPPEMHAFSPSEVFDIIYKDVCQSACRNSLFVDEASACLALPSGLVKMIKSSMETMFTNSLDLGQPIVEMHRHLLERLHRRFKAIRSLSTCLVCLCRRVQYKLSCGHSICETCVKLFGLQCHNDPWTLQIEHCPLCGGDSGGFQIRVLPETAGIRVVTFDGGGVRGIVTLIYLDALQDRIGLPIPIQNNFDFAMGTSSGGIIELGLYVNGWSVNTCMQHFERLARSAFEPRMSLKIPLLSQAKDLLMWIFEDGRYPAKNIEAALQEAFGKERGMLEDSHATATGTKIGLTATTILDASACIFTNYDVDRPRSPGCGYHVMATHDKGEHIPLWEIARCTSAAPSYFKSKHITGIGSFQDGGLKFNDPLSIALQEVSVIFPKAAGPGLVVSLGTGCSKLSTLKPRMSAYRGILLDGWIPRLFRACKSSLGAKYKCYRPSGEEKERYFRFDVEFEGLEPRLDDLSKIQELKCAAKTYIEGSPELDRLARRMLAELFLFELDTIPVKKNGRYVCSGRILCRVRAGDAAFNILLQRLRKRFAVFMVQDSATTTLASDSFNLDSSGNYCQLLQFEVQSRTSDISIKLQEASLKGSGISGSPFNIDRLIASQQLKAPFGRSDHVKRQLEDVIDNPRKRRKL